MIRQHITDNPASPPVHFVLNVVLNLLPPSSGGLVASASPLLLCDIRRFNAAGNFLAGKGGSGVWGISGSGPGVGSGSA